MAESGLGGVWKRGQARTDAACAPPSVCRCCRSTLPPRPSRRRCRWSTPPRPALLCRWASLTCEPSPDGAHTHRGRRLGRGRSDRNGRRRVRPVAPSPSGCTAARLECSAADAAIPDFHREGVGPETGGNVFDPMGLSKIASEETLAWYRAAELKHSRVAMVGGRPPGAVWVVRQRGRGARLDALGGQRGGGGGGGSGGRELTREQLGCTGRPRQVMGAPGLA